MATNSVSDECSSLAFWPPIHEQRGNAKEFTNLQEFLITTEDDSFHSCLEGSNYLEDLRDIGLRVDVMRASTNANIFLVVDNSISTDECSYNIDVKNDRVVILASDSATLLYGFQTLVQLFKLHSHFQEGGTGVAPCLRVPTVQLIDKADVGVRAVMLSASHETSPYGDIPEMKENVEMLSKAHINKIFLVLDYASSDANSALELSRKESVHLDKYIELCDRYFITVELTVTVLSPKQKLHLTEIKKFVSRGYQLSMVFALNYQTVAAELSAVDAESVSSACRNACEQLFKSLISIGVTSIALSSSEWASLISDPASTATSAGLTISNVQDFETMYHSSLFIKPVACIQDFAQSIAAMVDKAANGLSSSSSECLYPAFSPVDISRPDLLNKGYLLLYAGLVWRLSTAQQLNLTEVEDAAIVSREKQLHNALAYHLKPSVHNSTKNNRNVRGSICRVAKKLPSSTAVDAVISVLTGEAAALILRAANVHSMYVSGVTSGGGGNGPGLDAENHAVTMHDLAKAEKLLWALATAYDDLSFNAVPTKAEAALCLKLYRRILSIAKWKPNRPRSSDESDSVLQEYDAFFSTLNLMGTLSRSVFLSSTGCMGQALGDNPMLDAGVDNVQNVAQKRDAVYDNVDISQPYVPKAHAEKSESITELLNSVVRKNILFRNYKAEQHAAIVHGFEAIEAAAGEKVIRQGDPGESFYILEYGKASIFMESSGFKIKIGRPLCGGDYFGELALMYNTPRAATVVCSEPCKLWRIDRTTYRHIVTHHSKTTAIEFVSLFSNVHILGRRIGDIFSTSELNKVVSSLEVEEFEDGAVIVRQYLTGDYFYIITEGQVDVWQQSREKVSQRDRLNSSPSSARKTGSTMCALGSKVATLARGDYFGEKALLADDVRQASCVAVGRTVCLSLSREDFIAMLGSWPDSSTEPAGLKRGSGSSDTVAAAAAALDSLADPHEAMSLGELEVVSTLGVGAFGKVRLVKHNQTGQQFALKSQSKAFITAQGMRNMLISEMQIMRSVNHPCIARLFSAMQDSKYVYFVLELLSGGEFFNYLQVAGKLSEDKCRFYSASVISAFGELHRQKIAYRDLKPENMVMDERGYVKLVDLGLAKRITDSNTWTMCGTPDYLAPEIVLNKGHNCAVDFWALGVLVYEMVHGWPPFYHDDQMKVYAKIISGKVNYPEYFSNSLEDVVSKLLTKNPSKRLGNMKGGIADLIKHKWFGSFDWTGLLEGTVKAPYVPDPSAPPFDAGDDGTDEPVEDSDWVIDLSM